MRYTHVLMHNIIIIITIVAVVFIAIYDVTFLDHQSSKAYASGSMPVLQLPWPVGQSHDINGGDTYGCGGHNTKRDSYAIDFNLPAGSQVSAVADGTAHFAIYPTGQNYAYGLFVWISHPNNYVSLYAHLSAFPTGVKVGDQHSVVQGEVIGFSGATGAAQGAHLHFSLRSGATSWMDGTSAQPEPMSNYTGFGQFGIHLSNHCGSNTQSQMYTSALRSASLKVSNGITVTSSQPVTLGRNFSATFVVINSGDSYFWLTQLSIWGQDPNGNPFMIYGDNNGGGNIYVGAHSTRTLNAFVQNFASNCSNCVAGNYNILAEYQDTNNGAYHLIGPNGGTNPIAINVTANGIPNNKLTSGQTLNPGQRLTSDNGAVFLAMQSDGNLVEYVTRTEQVLWASNTYGNPGTILVNQSSDGNMVLYAPGWRAIWATNIYGIQNLMLVVQNDGNVVVYTPQGQPVWATGTNFL